MRYAGLIAGLGNPGLKYAGTRHNMGFMFVEELLETAAKRGATEELNGKKFNSALWRVRLPDMEGEWLAAMPLTFMNDSGRAVQPLLAWHNLRPDQLVVAHDEMDIPAGALRFKYGGGLAGHNGLASIAAQLGTKDFYRLRIGIGKPPHKDETLGWVLGSPAPADRDKITGIMPYAMETFVIFNRQGAERATQFAHAAAKRALEGDGCAGPARAHDLSHQS